MAENVEKSIKCMDVSEKLCNFAASNKKLGV